VTILHESDEGTMQDLRKIAVGGRRGRNATSHVRTSTLFIWKSEPYMLDACLGKDGGGGVRESPWKTNLGH
jgi:hypothetical protein